jgi:hypothetical protein
LLKLAYGMLFTRVALISSSLQFLGRLSMQNCMIAKIQTRKKTNEGKKVQAFTANLAPFIPQNNIIAHAKMSQHFSFLFIEKKSNNTGDAQNLKEKCLK